MNQVSFTESNDKNKKNDKEINNKETIRWHGKEMKINKLQKKVSHKPRILGPILINLAIILIIIIVILLVL